MEFPTLDRIERLVSNFEGWQREMTERIAQVDEEGVEAVADSGLVRAASSSAGKVLRLVIEPRAMRMPSEDLAAEVLQAIQRSQRAAADQVREALRSVVGENPA